MPRVSVLICSYNRGPLLERAARSVLTQTFQDFELIIADDASTDPSTVSVIHRLAEEDSRAVPLIAAHNRGLSINWNEALAACRGEYIADLGDDDLMLPEKLARQVDYLDSHPGCGMTTHDVNVIDGADSILYRFSDRFAPIHGTVGDLMHKEWFPRKAPGYLLCSMVARGAFLRSSRYDPRLKYNNEWLYIIECLLQTGQTWDYMPELLGCYRVHGPQLHRSDDYQKGVLEETLIVGSILAARHPELARGIRDSRTFALMEHCLYDYAAPEQRRDFEALFRSEAGLPRWLLMRLYRALRSRGSILRLTRPLRRAMRMLPGFRGQVL